MLACFRHMHRVIFVSLVGKTRVAQPLVTDFFRHVGQQSMQPADAIDVLITRCRQHADHAVVSFVTGVFIDIAITRSEGKFTVPRMSIECIIVHRKGIVDFIGTGTREALCYPGILADIKLVLDRAAQTLLRMELRGFNHQGIPLPVTDGVAHPRTNLGWQRFAIDSDVAYRVIHLDHNLHLTR